MPGLPQNAPKVPRIIEQNQGELSSIDENQEFELKSLESKEKASKTYFCNKTLTNVTNFEFLQTTFEINEKIVISYLSE